jgi:tetratricopeptide (TPR) repeat protein
LNPNYVLAHHWYGNLYFALLGNHEKAIAELKRVQILDPLSLSINTDLGWAYEMAGQNDDAIISNTRAWSNLIQTSRPSIFGCRNIMKARECMMRG